MAQDLSLSLMRTAVSEVHLLLATMLSKTTTTAMLAFTDNI